MKYPNIVYSIGEKIFPYKIHKPFTVFIKKYYKDRKNLIGCEIGVWNGNNARSMLNYLPIKMLYLIDPYVSNYEIINDISKDTIYGKKYYDIAKKNLKKYVSKYHFIIQSSEKAIGYIPNDKDFFDFVYIDGNHNYPFVKKDIDLYYPLVKKDGILGGHDYLLWNGVHKAVDELLDEKDLKIMGWCHDWWVVKK